MSWVHAYSIIKMMLLTYLCGKTGVFQATFIIQRPLCTL